MLQPLRREPRGFTLIELLVVVTIIGLLAALLFPVFSRAREKARQTVCSSNLRQIGVAFALYLSDNDGDYPCDTSDPYLWQGQHFRWPIMPYLGIAQARQSGGGVTATSADSKILHCPSDPTSAATFNNTSYAYSAAFYLPQDKLAAVVSPLMLYGPPYGALPVVPQAQSESEVTMPGNKILAGEWTDNHDGVTQPPVGWYPGAGTPTTSRVYLFADYHVKYLPLTQIAKGYSGMPDPNTTINGLAGSDNL